MGQKSQNTNLLQEERPLPERTIKTGYYARFGKHCKPEGAR
jgi:hypothetical protein